MEHTLLLAITREWLSTIDNYGFWEKFISPNLFKWPEGHTHIHSLLYTFRTSECYMVFYLNGIVCLTLSSLYYKGEAGEPKQYGRPWPHGNPKDLGGESVRGPDW